MNARHCHGFLGLRVFLYRFCMDIELVMEIIISFESDTNIVFYTNLYKLPMHITDA